MTQHKQVLANVKTLVDSSIKEVIEALNLIPELWTFGSCEGEQGEQSEISLCYGEANNDYINIAQVANDLYNLARSKGCHIAITIEWDSDRGYSPIMVIYFEKTESNAICDAVFALLGAYNNDEDRNHK